MDHHDQHHDDMSSPRSYTDSQWSPPPPGFRELDQIYAADGSPHTYSNPNSPPAVSPPLPYEHEYHQHPQPQNYETYQQGYSTEKETPYGTVAPIGKPTPDFEGPEVVPGQFSHYPHGGRPMSPSSHGGTTLTSPHIRPYGFKEHVDPYDNHEAAPPPVPPKDDRKCGMKKRTFFILIGVIVIAIVALALGLGLGLGLNKDDSDEGTVHPFCRENPESCIGGSLNSEYLSKKGVFNGTGIALAGESWNKGQRRIFTLYFQHHTGDIRFMQYTTDRKWIGGGKAQTVAGDAKDASPISAVAFALNETQYFHIFYIDKNNTVKQLIQSNTSDIWQPGPLSDLNLKAFDSPTTGLQACYKGNFYGDNDYTKFPTASGLNNTEQFEGQTGMNIWFATDDSTFLQYAWYSGQDDTWAKIEPWSGFNGHAGVGCYSWGAGTTSYAMLNNKDNDVEFWWKDTNQSAPSTPTHPINSWQNASMGAIKDVYPITSLGYTTYFYAQMADRSIKGFNITYNAENTTYIEDETFTVTDISNSVVGLGGTHLTVTAFAEKRGEETLWDSLYVFFQTAGDDITAFTRGLNGGEWTKGSLSIPDE
ncbi:hypothetical protein GT037_001068 [Alternaria burnsii]|uniref:Fucose-specific lectin n=1 Tax=Alternaria burnsii TaxID=1187904 RepID=A0A8H7BCA4_9PLEO|nr:uncharacterized protein GT037_001068 [Alternaria burnsii]KAF7682092.1 hypothetical protein GT037_001068 [Alternaria burnsii]CAI9636034.1 unnamed protein product [Alternaria burnsii]